MALFRTYQPNTRLDHYDLEGLINRLGHAEEESDDEIERAEYRGARIALHIARYHEFVDTQEDFMRLFGHYRAGGEI